MNTLQVQRLSLHIKHLALALGALLLCLLLGASTTFAGMPHGRFTPNADCAIAGTMIPSPNEVSSEPNSEFVAISAVSANDIWAVGALYYAQVGSRALVRHWNGTTWIDVPVPGAADSVLNDVDAISGNNVWIVGSIGVETLTLRWDGTQFTRVVSPNSGSFGSYLHGVDARAANDVWAVGNTTRTINPWSIPRDGLAMHWDGIRWTIFPSFAAGGERTITLEDVSVITMNDAWAVGTLTCFAGSPANLDGSCPDPGYTNAITLHWDGTQWTNVSTGHSGYGYYEELSAVHAVTSNDVWAVGRSISPSTSNTIHWDGQAWSYVNAPARLLLDVSGLASNLVWAVGYDTAGYVLLRWDGQGWTATQLRGHSAGPLHALSALASNNIYLAGHDSGSPSTSQASLYRWNGNTLTNAFLEQRTPIPLENTFRAVEGSGSGDIWAVGYHSLSGSTLNRRWLVQHWDGYEWATIPASNCTTCALNDVTVISQSDAWMVGYASGPRVIGARWDGTSWSTARSPELGLRPGALQGVDSISSGELWAVGYYSDTTTSPETVRPLTMRWNGSTQWDMIAMPDLGTGTDARLNDVKVLSPTEVWAVGTIKANSTASEQTLTIHWDGTQWTQIPTPNVGPSRSTLRTVTAAGPNDVWAAGYYGPSGTGQVLYLHWDGTAWSVVPAPSVGTDSFILSLEQIAPNNIWAVGNYLPGTGGTPRTLVERWDGVSWRQVDSPSPTTTGGNYLWGAYAPPDAQGDEVWTVGSYANPQGTQQTLTVRFIESLFTDVPSGSTFYPYIRCLVERNIISGYADCTFRPNNQVTRGQLAKIVSNSAGFTEPPTGQTFEDVPPTHTFYEWIERLAARGYMTGYNCGSPGEPCTTGRPYFRPFANATRGQTSKIVANAAGFSEPPTGQTFEDVPPTHTFYEFIQRLASRSVMQGYNCGGPGEPCITGRPYFRPQNDVTRGQSTKIVANTFFPDCEPAPQR